METTPKIESIPVWAIAPSPLNPRKKFDEDALRELANDINLNGVLEPITVRPAKGAAVLPAFEGRAYVIVMGERRWRAAGMAQFDEIPCIVREDLDDAAHLRMAYSENEKRSNLTAYECALAYERMLELEPNLTQEALGNRLGVSQSRVANRLRLLKLYGPARRHLESGAISESVALVLCGLLETPELIDDLAEQAAEDGWTLSRTEDEVRAVKVKLSEKAERERAQQALPLDVPEPEPRAGYSARNNVVEDTDKPVVYLFWDTAASGWRAVSPEGDRGDILGASFGEAANTARSQGVEPRNVFKTDLHELTGSPQKVWWAEQEENARGIRRDTPGAEPGARESQEVEPAPVTVAGEEGDSAGPTPPPAIDEKWPVVMDPADYSNRNLPEGQKSTWYQWCSNSLHDSKKMEGLAWVAYCAGWTGGEYRAGERRRDGKTEKLQDLMPLVRAISLAESELQAAKAAESFGNVTENPVLKAETPSDGLPQTLYLLENVLRGRWNACDQWGEFVDADDSRDALVARVTANGHTCRIIEALTFDQIVAGGNRHPSTGARRRDLEALWESERRCGDRPEPKAVGGAVAIPQDLEDWLWEKDRTAVDALNLLRENWEFVLTPKATELLTSIMAATVSGEEAQPSPMEFLERHLEEWAEVVCPVEGDGDGGSDG